jgi:hypothetical protein
MDRKSPQQTKASRRSTTGVALVTVAMVLVIATAYAASGTPGRAAVRSFPNPSGVAGTVGIGDADAGNPFFQELGTNGRTCATCHMPAQGMEHQPGGTARSL